MEQTTSENECRNDFVGMLHIAFASGKKKSEIWPKKPTAPTGKNRPPTDDHQYIINTATFD